VQQGDPLGPLLFSLALHRALTRVKVREPTECPAPLDFTVAYLDDMFVAGTDAAVSWFCDALKDELERMGLALSLDKCIITPSSGADTLVDQSRFLGWLWNPCRNLKVLGAAVGDEIFSKALVQKRRQKAKRILSRLGQLSNVQAALPILRSCAGFAKLVHNSRTSPPSSILDELAAFDDDVKTAFVEFSQLTPDSPTWARAQRTTGTGGLGLRSSAKHAAAAFTASSINTATLQSKICPDMTEADVLSEPQLQEAIGRLPRSEALAALVAEGFGLSQRMLSRTIDRADADSELLDRRLPDHMKAHTQLSCTGGADSWIHAYPSAEAGTVMDSELFRLDCATSSRSVAEQSCHLPIVKVVLGRLLGPCAGLQLRRRPHAAPRSCQRRVICGDSSRWC